MKTLKILTLMLSIIGVASTGLIAGDKYYVPSWDMPRGEITAFPKGHVATTEYRPNLAVNYDKQHVPWFESTLKPQNLRKEGQGDLLEEVGQWISGIFKK